jgi:hypothetical protein
MVFFMIKKRTRPPAGFYVTETQTHGGQSFRGAGNISPIFCYHTNCEFDQIRTGTTYVCPNCPNWLDLGSTAWLATDYRSRWQAGLRVVERAGDQLRVQRPFQRSG